MAQPGCRPPNRTLPTQQLGAGRASRDARRPLRLTFRSWADGLIGFEAPPSHRGRCPPALQRSVLLFAEQSSAGPQQMLVADPAQQADPVEEFQDLDRPLAPQTGRVTK